MDSTRLRLQSYDVIGIKLSSVGRRAEVGVCAGRGVLS